MLWVFRAVLVPCSIIRTKACPLSPVCAEFGFQSSKLLTWQQYPRQRLAMMPTGRFHVPLRIFIVCSSIYVVWTLFRWWWYRSPYDLNARVPILKGEDLTKPPIYPALFDRERRMPQNNEWAPPPNGRSGMLPAHLVVKTIRHVI